MLFLIVQYNGNNNRGDEKSDKTKNILFIYLVFYVEHYIMLLISFRFRITDFSNFSIIIMHVDIKNSIFSYLV